VVIHEIVARSATSLLSQWRRACSVTRTAVVAGVFKEYSMNPKSPDTDAISKEQPSIKSGQAKEGTEANGSSRFSQSSWWGNHSSYDWMDHCTTPNIPLW
jgi:hypothetical protein